MGFQSTGPKLELVWSTCPQNSCDVDSWVFGTNCFDVLICFFSTKRFAAQALKSLLPKMDSSSLLCHQQEFQPYCLFCVCCYHHPTCVSQWNPHIQCKMFQGTCFCLLESWGTILTAGVRPSGCLLGFLWKKCDGDSDCKKDHEIAVQVKCFMTALAVRYGKTWNNQLSVCFHRL